MSKERVRELELELEFYEESAQAHVESAQRQAAEIVRLRKALVDAQARPADSSGCEWRAAGSPWPARRCLCWQLLPCMASCVPPAPAHEAGYKRLSCLPAANGHCIMHEPGTGRQPPLHPECICQLHRTHPRSGDEP